MNNYLITKPAREPVTLQQAKDHLNIDFTDDDALIEMIIIAARESVENQTGRVLITSTLGDERDCFDSQMELQYTAQSITSIEYIDTDGATQALAATEYDLDTNRTPARITLGYGKTYPSIRSTYNAVTITYVSGYGDNAEDVPAPIRSAILLLVGHLYENREASAPINISEVPMSVKFLLSPYKIMSF